MSMAGIAMLFTYGMLTLLWIWVFVVVSYLIPSEKGAMPGNGNLHRIKLAAQLFSIILAIDSVYWFVANGSYYELFPFAWHAHLRNPWLIALIKLAVVVSAALFLIILRRSSIALQGEVRNKWFSRIVDLTWDAVGVLDSEGKMLFWNRGAERLFGFPKEEVTGLHIRDFLVPQDRWDEVDKALVRVKEKRIATTNYRTQRRRSDGSLIWVDISISPIVEEGEFHGYFGIMRTASDKASE